ncbi:AAA family ATPase [Tersicoccus sp. MR15.9]|uniref:AAA family ATPase n=1 Tax=Tersicoccus mangrovi TaxID=3121635 RepID=UPI002FE56793
MVRELRVDGEADRRVERLGAFQIGHRQVDEHGGHRSLLIGWSGDASHTCKKQVARQECFRTYLRNFDVRRSASGLPPVWQRRVGSRPKSTAHELPRRVASGHERGERILRKRNQNDSRASVRVTRIEFRGYRRLADTASNIDGQLTAFVGFNEAGKTSLLHALEWFSSGSVLSELEYNRSRPPEDDSASVVKVYFELEDQDRAVFAHVPVEDAPNSCILYRRPDGGRTYEFRPRPRRPRGPFVEAADRLKSATKRLAKQLEEESSNSDGPNEWSASVMAALDRPDDEWDQSTRNCLQHLCDWFGEVPTGRKRARDSQLVGLLERVESLIAVDHPLDSIWNAVKGREPKFVLFNEEDRALETSYNLSPQQRDIPRAVDRLLYLSGIDIDDMWTYVQNGDTSKRETALERGNDRLRSIFDQAWNQSKVTVRFNVNAGRLEVLIKELHGDGDVTNIGERSDGLKAFVALVAFIEAGGYDVPPILLIDEAETHLHYDAQADLVGVLLKSVDVKQVFYTTHSPGCLPGDLGTGIRVLARDPNHADSSIVKSNFWDGEGPGFSPLLFAMGAGAAAFSVCRSAVLAEGASDMVLLPSLIRMATGLSDLDYQIAPGLANAHGSGIRVEEVAAKVVYLVDGDEGGSAHKAALQNAGVEAGRIFSLPEGAAVEDLVATDVYISVIGSFLAAMGENRRFTHSDAVSNIPITKSFHDWAKQHGIGTPGKVEVCYALLRHEDLRLTAVGAKVLKSLHAKFVQAFDA